VRWLFTSYTLLLSPPPVCPCLARELWPPVQPTPDGRVTLLGSSLSPGHCARAVCCWLRDAWGLHASNDLLSVSAAPPPHTQSPMRS